MAGSNGAAAVSQGQSRPTLLAIIYSKTKRGKSSDSLRAFPRSLCIGVRAAIELPGESICGFTPKPVIEGITNLQALVTYLEQLAASGAARGFSSILVDDASHICQQSMLAWDAEKGNNFFYPYKMLDSWLLRLAAICRRLGVHLIMNFHEKEPGIDQKTMRPTQGGPLVPSKGQVDTVPSWCDLVLRAIPDPDSPDLWWPMAYWCRPTDPQWITADRNNVCWTKTPMNLREILRASPGGYHLDRLPGLEWQDEWAEIVCTRMLAGEPPRDICIDVAARWKEHVKHPSQQIHLMWACQDGIARAVIRKRQSLGLFNFEALAEPVAGPVVAPLPLPATPPEGGLGAS